MNEKFIYYGGKEITDKIICDEITNIENDSSDDLEETTKFDDELQCEFFNEKCSIRLKDRIGEPGGEGVVYSTTISGMVAKIYWPKMRTKFREEKLILMIENQIDNNFICWPKGILFHDKEFVGFIMPLIDGSLYEKVDPECGISVTSNFFKDNRKNVLVTLINIMSIFETLRLNNIVMGDVNFNNFMINKETYDVMLIDLDGAQIDKFPCMTCKAYFNAPEIFKGMNDLNYESQEEHIANSYYHKNYSTFYRDDYSLAVYSFYILMGVKPFKNIVSLSKREFLYDIYDEDKTTKTMGDTYSCRWSHLPFFVREAFFNSFTTKNYNARLKPNEWKGIFNYYLELLEEDKIKKLDPDCLTVYNEDKDRIDYSILLNLKYIYKFSMLSYGFTIKETIKKIFKEFKNNGIDKEIDSMMITEYLKHNTFLKINNYTFKLILDIGVLKKISVEYKKDKL